MPSSHVCRFSTYLIEPIVTAFSDHLTSLHADAIQCFGLLLVDPFGGTAERLGEIASGIGATPCAIELEQVYVDEARALGVTWVHQGDSRELWFLDDNSILAAVTSPAYPNGMTDNHHAKDTSRRNTYIHRIRETHPDYELHPDNPAGLSARSSKKGYAKMLEVHAAVWAEMFRVMMPGGIFIVNTKNTPHIPFTAHTKQQLLDAGFELVEHRTVEARGNNHQQHADRKVAVEDLLIVRKP
jgi:hypothetical protein